MQQSDDLLCDKYYNKKCMDVKGGLHFVTTYGYGGWVGVGENEVMTKDTCHVIQCSNELWMRHESGISYIEVTLNFCSPISIHTRFPKCIVVREVG